MFTPQTEQTRNTSALPTTQRAANTNTTVAFRPKRHHAPAERERFARSLRWGDSVFAFNKTENIFVMMMVLSTFAKGRASRATRSCFLHACAPASYP